MASKVVFVERCRACAQAVATAAALAAELAAVYFDRGYGADGPDALADVQIPNTGVTAAQIGDFVNFCQQLVAFRDGGQPLAADWGAILNKLRGDL